MQHATSALFTRMECSRCDTRFHFTDRPPASRVPSCPGCGSLAVYAQELLADPVRAWRASRERHDRPRPTGPVR
jgi:hypothetical protein